MAVRDQIIDEQRTVVGNLWRVLGELAPSERISDIACELGIEVDTAAEGTVQVLDTLMATLGLSRRPLTLCSNQSEQDACACRLHYLLVNHAWLCCPYLFSWA